MTEHSSTGSWVIRGGLVADGSGGEPRANDVVVENGTIAAVEPPGRLGHDRLPILDVSKLVVAPGFIDVHSHADNAPLLAEDDTTKILQGVTTEVVGNCGFSLAPSMGEHAAELADLLGRLFPIEEVSWRGIESLWTATDSAGYVTNYAPLVGHGTLRIAAMGMQDRSPSPAELDVMTSLLDECLDAGAFGFSSGLIYPPGMFAHTPELVRLAGRLRDGRLYATHLRNEGARLLESIDEALTIGRGASCRVQVSHLKSAGRPNWGGVDRALETLRDARAHGVDAGQDVYPYDASSTMLTSCLPSWFQDGGGPAVLARLADPSSLRAARAEIEGDPRGGFENQVNGAGYDGILIASTASHRHEGRTLTEIAETLGVSPFDAMVTVLRDEALRVSMVLFSMTERDVEAVLADPATMIGSDGLPPGVGGRAHPRLYGTFPRVLGRFVRDRGLLGLGEAVAKMTSLPAQTFGLRRRGRVDPGFIADLVAFDPDTVSDVGSYADPVHSPTGISWVMQAGHVVVRDGEWSGLRLGARLTPG
ncbi:MAG: N-acyl-D-amino-acid deacylase family protein [Mycobacteriales bacterium]|nr:MAG: N-acyl-D-amino-acid deacylase [Pseudonocardiales bacterium]